MTFCLILSLKKCVYVIAPLLEKKSHCENINRKKAFQSADKLIFKYKISKV